MLDPDSRDSGKQEKQPSSSPAPNLNTNYKPFDYAPAVGFAPHQALKPSFNIGTKQQPAAASETKQTAKTLLNQT